MKLTNLRQRTTRRGRRVAADVVWEESAEPTRSLTFETESGPSDGSTPSWNPFAVACLPLASWHGERRLRVSGPLCPDLRDGLECASLVFEAWFPRCSQVTVEAHDRIRRPSRSAEPCTVSFLSGGVDALALLRANRRRYPAAHPDRIGETLLVFGLNHFEFDDDRPRPLRLAAFDRYRRTLAAFAEEAGAPLGTVHTNARTLYPGFDAWWSVGFGACLVACGHASPAARGRLLMGSDGPPLVPMASHPVLAPHFSTATTTVAQRQIGTRRFDKIRSVASWPSALRVLKTCLEREVDPEGPPNCGTCEKCVRTMLALEALGALRRAPTYPADEVAPDRVHERLVQAPWHRELLSACADLLERRGRGALAVTIRDRIAAHDRGRRSGGVDRIRRAARRLRSLLPTVG